MSARFFIDTNILVYANDRSDPVKLDIARGIIARAFANRQAAVSTQVLQEFFVALTRKAGVPPDNARAQVQRIASLDLVLIDRDLVLAAIDLHRLHQVSFWDALIIRIRENKPPDRAPGRPFAPLPRGRRVDS